MDNVDKGQIIIYQDSDNNPEIEVRLLGDTIWLTQQQMAELYGVSRTTIVEHISNIYSEDELLEIRTCRKFRQVRAEGRRQVARELPYYNLDMIISVGYRVKSKVATQFRIWATTTLRNYILNGYVINQKRLSHLGKVVKILERSEDYLLAGSANLLSAYISSLNLLRDYDDNAILTRPKLVPKWQLTLDKARSVIQEVAAAYPTNSMLGLERGQSLASIIESIYQTFGGNELYPTVEDKAANLLYMMVKDHPLADGNKRAAAMIFITFLAKNDALYTDTGEARIKENTLVAITLMVALSKPQEKESVIEVIIQMLGT